MALPITASGFSWTHTDRDVPAVGPLDLQIAAGEKVLPEPANRQSFTLSQASCPRNLVRPPASSSSAARNRILAEAAPGWSSKIPIRR